MTAVRLVESSKYGARLFAYLFVAVAVGAALFGLGWMLAWPAVLDALSGQSTVDTAGVAAGTVLAVLGVYVAGSGLLATINKFVADSVSQGVDAADLDLDVELEADTEPTESKPTATGAAGEVGDTTATEGPFGDTTNFPTGDAGSTGVKDSSRSPGESDETDAAVADELTDKTGADSEPEPLGRRTTEVVEPSSETSETDDGDDTPFTGSAGQSGEPTDEPGSLEADQDDFPREPSAEEIAFGTAGTDPEGERSSSPTDPLAEQTDDE